MSSARSGSERPAEGPDLLSLVAADLGDVEVVRSSGSGAVVTPRDPGRPAFTVEARIERRRLLELRTLAIHVHGPPTEVHDAAVIFHHRGQLRRAGLTARLAGRDRAVVGALRDRLIAGGELEAASLRLDFTRFEVRPARGRWRATLELMGGSHVRTRLPPSAHYVRLAPDQVEALNATVAVLDARLPGREPVRPGRPDEATGETVSVQRAGHLPRRAR